MTVFVLQLFCSYIVSIFQDENQHLKTMKQNHPNISELTVTRDENRTRKIKVTMNSSVGGKARAEFSKMMGSRLQSFYTHRHTR